MEKTFREWLEKTLDAGEIRDLAEHGADTGWTGLTYTSDCVELYNAYEEEIWEALREDADGMGYGNPMELVATFRRSDMLEDPSTFKNLLVWYMAERVAREIADSDED